MKVGENGAATDGRDTPGHDGVCGHGPAALIVMAGPVPAIRSVVSVARDRREGRDHDGVCGPSTLPHTVMAGLVPAIRSDTHQ